jgi:hypothetical protein
MEYTLADGSILNAPDGMSLGGAMDLAVQQGYFTPQEAQQQLEGQVSVPEIRSGLEAAGLNIAEFAAERSFGLLDRVNQQTLEQGQQDYPVSSFAGQAAPYLATAMMAPNTIAGQALMGAGTEALSADSTPQSILGMGTLAGAGVPIGKAIGMGAKSLSQRVQGKVAQQAGKMGRTVSERFPDARLAQWLDRGIADTTGFDDLVRARQSLLNKAVAKSFGQNADDALGITPDVLERATQDIGGRMDAIIPKSLKVDASGFIDDLSGLNVGTKANRILATVDDTGTITGTQFRDLRRALTERASSLRRGQGADIADDIALVVDDMDNVLGRAIGPEAKQALRIAKEQYKNLVMVEKIPEVVKTGNVPVSGLMGRLRSDQGYGRTFTNMRTDNLLPETTDMFMTLRELAQLGSNFPNSGTAARSMGIKALSGDPKSMMQAFISPVAGKGSLALGAMPEAPTAAGVAGSAAAQALSNDPQ